MHPQGSGVAWLPTRALLARVLVTAGCRAGRWPFRTRRRPPVVLETLTGLALGSCALGFLLGDLASRSFLLDTRACLVILASTGLVLLLLVVGSATGRPAPRGVRGGTALIAAASVLAPFAVLAPGWGQAPVPASGSGAASPRLAQALFLGVVSATAFPVLARTLSGAVPKRLLRGLTGSAAAGDVVPWVLPAAVVMMAGQVVGAPTVPMVVAFVGLLLALRHAARPLVATVLQRCPTASTNSTMALSLILGGIFLSSCVTAAMHLHPAFGAFTFGFTCLWELTALTAPAMVQKLADASKILMPAFFVTAGLSMSIKDFGVHGVLITVIVIIAASAAKILSMYETGRACRMSSQGSGGLGLLMSMQGLTELVILDIGRTAGVLSPRMFTVLAVTAIGTTLATGPLMEKIHLSDTASPVWLAEWRVRRGRVNTAFRYLSACLRPMPTWATATSAPGRPATQR